MGRLTNIIAVCIVVAMPVHMCAAEKPVKAYILAGQSNMVGWGGITKLPNDLRKGNDRVLLFEGGK